MNTAGKRPYRTVFAMITATLFSKLLGMARSMIMAWTLGDSVHAVAFAAASKIPGAVFDLLLSAAIVGCFIPTYNKAKEESENAAHEYSCSFLFAALSVCALLSAAGMILSPVIIKLSSPGISAEASALSASLLRIMFPMMIFAAGVYTLTGIMQSAGSFILPASVSSVSNVFIIVYLIAAKNNFSVYTLSFVYVISWFLQFSTLCVPRICKKLMPVPVLRGKNGYLAESLRHAPEVMMGAWFAPASVFIAAFFSSFVADTAFVTYDYAFGIYTIISGVAVYGVGNYVFPSLSRLYAKNEISEFTRELKISAFRMLAIVLPVFCASAILSYEGVALLYLRGNFTEALARDCAKALTFLSLAMPACAVSEILSRAFYASGKSRVPMYASLAAIAASVIFNSLSMLFQKGVVGISLSFAAAQWCHAAVLTVFLAVKFHGIFKPTDAADAIALALSGASSALAMAFFKKILSFSGIGNQTLLLFFKITIVFTLSLVIYLLCIYSLRYFSEKIKKEKR